MSEPNLDRPLTREQLAAMQQATREHRDQLLSNRALVVHVAAVLEARRADLVARPLARCWPELARAAIEAVAEGAG